MQGAASNMFQDPVAPDDVLRANLIYATIGMPGLQHESRTETVLHRAKVPQIPLNKLLA